MMDRVNVFDHPSSGPPSTSMASTSPAHYPLMGDASGFTGLSGVDDNFIIPDLNINTPLNSIEDNKDAPMAGLEESDDDNRTITAPVTPF